MNKIQTIFPMMDENNLSHNFIRLSFKVAKLNFCRLCSYYWFREMIASALFWTFSKSSHKYFGREWWNTCEQYSNRGLIHVQKKVRMSAVGTPKRFSQIRKYIRLLAFLIISPIWTFHWRSFERFRPKIFTCFTTLSRLPFTVKGSKPCLECLKSMMSSLHFSAFSWSLFSVDHFSTDVTASWT